MGTSTDAILFYGYCWDNEQRYPWEENEEDEDANEPDSRYAKAIGIEAPDEKYPESSDNSKEAIAARAKYSAYWYKKREAYKKMGVDVSTHCSGECLMPYVAITASRKIASRGCPEEITSLDVEADWDEKLKNFCKLMGIKPPQRKPRWWLVSDWN